MCEHVVDHGTHVVEQWASFEHMMVPVVAILSVPLGVQWGGNESGRLPAI